MNASARKRTSAQFPSLLALCFCCAAALAQTKPAPVSSPNQAEPTIRIATELIQIEVIVTDKAGKPVRDLKQADFELKQDGKPQDVSYFSFGTATQPARWITAEPQRREAAPTTTNPTARATGRYIVLVVDDFHLAERLMTWLYLR